MKQPSGLDDRLDLDSEDAQAYERGSQRNKEKEEQNVLKSGSRGGEGIQKDGVSIVAILRWKQHSRDDRFRFRTCLGDVPFLNHGSLSQLSAPFPRQRRQCNFSTAPLTVRSGARRRQSSKTPH